MLLIGWEVSQKTGNLKPISKACGSGYRLEFIKAFKDYDDSRLNMYFNLTNK